MKNTPFCIKAVLFDFDGTLIKPDTLNFKPNPGAEELILYLRSKDLRIGIISTNRLQDIERTIENFETISLSDFDLIISRDGSIKTKHGADWILLAAHNLSVDVKEVLVVGDYTFYGQAGKSAGAVTVCLDTRGESGASVVESDYTISHLEKLKKIVRMGLPLGAGKLPNDILEEFLNQFDFDDPSVLIHPGIGEDTTAVNVAEEEVLVLKSDPITFVTDSIGHYAVLINANDIATSGATPRWLLTTLLFPCGITASGIWHVMNELKEMCHQWDITLCGGHTEITDAVTRPVVTGMLTGTVAKSDLIDKRNMAQGDMILFTKAVAVEGTAIIALELEDRLKDLGILESEIEECKLFLSSISILEEAKMARCSEGVSALHDVTEGGLATALEELSSAGRHRIRIHMDRIPIFPQTKKLCRLLDIHPLGLIGSGSLLICCRKKYYESLMRMIYEAGIDVTCIGEVLVEGQGIDAVEQNDPVEWPYFEVDEIARLFNPD
ncbi:MAG: HAD hydrolase-like protein [Desulfobacteraceae bacterium]|nr:HAD hydrolase-like protein [Desulfobacteraceae bacterium]